MKVDGNDIPGQGNSGSNGSEGGKVSFREPQTVLEVKVFKGEEWELRPENRMRLDSGGV